MSELVGEDEVDEYLETVLFTSTDESDDRGGAPMDQNYGVSDFSEEARQRATRDLEAFRFEMDRVLEALGERADEVDLSRWPRDFWFTRNEHGTGFWDHEELYGPATEALDVLSKRAGEVYAYIGDDGQVHFG